MCKLYYSDNGTIPAASDLAADVARFNAGVGIVWAEGDRKNWHAFRAVKPTVEAVQAVFAHIASAKARYACHFRSVRNLRPTIRALQPMFMGDRAVYVQVGLWRNKLPCLRERGSSEPRILRNMYGPDPGNLAFVLKDIEGGPAWAIIDCHSGVYASGNAEPMFPDVYHTFMAFESPVVVPDSK